MQEFLSNIANAVGMIGVIMILVAYLLSSMGRWAVTDIYYQLVNFIGAALILFSLYYHWNLASVVIEIAWLMISVYGMYRALKLPSPCKKT